MEAMVDAGVHMGFSRRTAERLVIETIRGSVDYYDSGPEETRHLARLRNQVTSPGGTSAEALYYLEKAGFRTAISPSGRLATFGRVRTPKLSTRIGPGMTLIHKDYPLVELTVIWTECPAKTILDLGRKYNLPLPGIRLRTTPSSN
jgi:hypothetical protein